MSDDTLIDDENFINTYDDLDEDYVSTQTSQPTKRRAQKQRKTAVQSTAKAAANAKRKVQHNWKESEEAQLIQSVQNRGPLYDCSDPHYKNKYVKTNAWEDVANELGIADVDPDEAKNKWYALRNNFKTHLGRYRARKSAQGTDEINADSVKWPHYKSMMFVESADVAQSTASTSTLILVTI